MSFVGESGASASAGAEGRASEEADRPPDATDCRAGAGRRLPDRGRRDGQDIRNSNDQRMQRHHATVCSEERPLVSSARRRDWGSLRCSAVISCRRRDPLPALSTRLRDMASRSCDPGSSESPHRLRLRQSRSSLRSVGVVPTGASAGPGCSACGLLLGRRRRAGSLHRIEQPGQARKGIGNREGEVHESLGDGCRRRRFPAHARRTNRRQGTRSHAASGRRSHEPTNTSVRPNAHVVPRLAVTHRIDTS